MRSDQGGFTLMEVLVAIAILALVLGPILQMLGDGLRAGPAMDRRLAALALAQSRLAAAGIETPLRPGSDMGEAAGLRWRTEIAPWPEDDRLWEVAVHVGPLTLRSLRPRTGRDE